MVVNGRLISLDRACSTSDAQQHVTDLALLIQLALLRALQGDQKVCRLVRHRTMLVQHHTEALQTFTPASQVAFCTRKTGVFGCCFPIRAARNAQLGLP